MLQFVSIASPLHSLMKKDTVLSWASECQDACDDLNNSLMTGPVVAYQFNHPLILETGRCQHEGPWAVLAQQETFTVLCLYHDHFLPMSVITLPQS